MKYEDVAKAIHDGAHAESLLEDKLWNMFGEDLYDKFTTDWYDNSVEIFLTSAEPYTLSEENVAAIFRFGFSRFWLRFPDNSEQSFLPDKRTERKNRGTMPRYKKCIGGCGTLVMRAEG